MSDPSGPRERRILPPARVKPPKPDSKYPWLMPSVIAFCVIVIVFVVVFTSSIGHLFS